MIIEPNEITYDVSEDESIVAIKVIQPKELVPAEQERIKQLY